MRHGLYRELAARLVYLLTEPGRDDQLDLVNRTEEELERCVPDPQVVAAQATLETAQLNLMAAWLARGDMATGAAWIETDSAVRAAVTRSAENIAARAAARMLVKCDTITQERLT